MSPEQQRQMLTILSQAGPDVLGKAQEMLTEFGKHVPSHRLWKLGPVAVVPDLQGQGVGSRMVEQFCTRMEALGDPACLDTDQIKNVRLYEKFGFDVVDEAAVLGVPMWFMARPATKRGR
jgi:predicted N-acetyltransferase YhbS